MSNRRCPSVSSHSVPHSSSTAGCGSSTRSPSVRRRHPHSDPDCQRRASVWRRATHTSMQAPSAKRHWHQSQAHSSSIRRRDTACRRVRSWLHRPPTSSHQESACSPRDCCWDSSRQCAYSSPSAGRRHPAAPLASPGCRSRSASTGGCHCSSPPPVYCFRSPPPSTPSAAPTKCSRKSRTARCQSPAPVC